MRRLALSTFALAILASGLSAQNAPIAKRRVAVLDFDYSTVQGDVAAVMGTNQDIGKGIADMIVTQLVKNGTYSVIERKKMDQIMAEQNFQQSGRTDPSTAVQLAKILGVDAVIMGSITQFGRDDHNVGVSAGGLKVGGFGLGSVGTKSAKAVVAIDARIVSTTTAEILDVAKGKGESSRSGLSLGAARGGRRVHDGELELRRDADRRSDEQRGGQPHDAARRGRLEDPRERRDAPGAGRGRGREHDHDQCRDVLRRARGRHLPRVACRQGDPRSRHRQSDQASDDQCRLDHDHRSG